MTLPDDDEAQQVADELHDLSPGEYTSGSLSVLGVEYEYSAERHDREVDILFGLFTRHDTSITMLVGQLDREMEIPEPVEKIEDGPAGVPVIWAGEGPRGIVAAQIREAIIEDHYETYTQ